MSIAHLDVSYFGIPAFLADCETCHVNGQALLDNGDYEYLPDGYVVSMHYFEPEAFERRGMDVRPSAWQSRLNTWESSINPEQCWPAFAEEAAQYIGEFLPPYGPQATNPAENEYAVSDALGMYMMGEEL